MTAPPPRLVCRSRTLDLSEPLVMGVLNVTPDSFSDGGLYADPASAVDHALAMIEAGAAIIDVGGESTRPGAAPTGSDEERRRVVPVVERLAQATRVAISVDTSDPAVMTAAVAAGAEIINDVRALRREGALTAAARSGAAICLMHMQGEPASMQQDPRYTDVVAEVSEFLRERIASCLAAGIDLQRLCIDPASASARRMNIICGCSPGSSRCARSDRRCWLACRGNRWSVSLRDGRFASAARAAARSRRSQSSAARASSARTMWPRRSMQSGSPRRCAVCRESRER
jgi:dihydropteroate synthase